MPRLALLLCLGTARAAVDTCATLRAELTRRSCDDHVLPLTGRAPDGTIVHLRCTDGYDSCSRTDTNPSHTLALLDPSSPWSSSLERGPPGPLAPASTTAADDYRAPPHDDARSIRTRRHLFSTTPSPTPIPTPAPTLVPTPGPTASPIPTTVDITSFNQ